MNYSYNRPSTRGAPYETGRAGAATAWSRSPRVKLFGLVFLIVLSLGAIWLLLQSPVYRSSASILMDDPTGTDLMPEYAIVQNAAVQRRILLGGEVLGGTLARFNETFDENIDSQQLAGMLEVTGITGTNLAEMSATGPDRDILPPLVNTWIEVYKEMRAAEVARARTLATAMVEGELVGVDEKLQQARLALAAFRKEHNITSAERQENKILARLEGLHDSLNKAMEVEVNAGARVEAMESAIEQGERIVPRESQRGLERLEDELQDLQAGMSMATERYTAQYLARKPEYRAALDRIATLRQEIAVLVREGQNDELAAARQAQQEAGEAVIQLQQQLDEHERTAERFSATFATYTGLVEEYEGLKELRRERQGRANEADLRDEEKYPHVAVIDPPGAVARRLGPDYPMLAAAILGGSLLSGILAVWLHGFLGHQGPQPGQVTLSGVHFYPPPNGGAIGVDTAEALHIAGTTGHLLPGSLDAPPAEDGEGSLDVSSGDGHSDDQERGGTGRQGSGPRSQTAGGGGRSPDPDDNG